MLILKKFNYKHLLYISAIFLLIPTISMLGSINIKPFCNFYTDYLFCSYLPQDINKYYNFFYLLIFFFLSSFCYFKIINFKYFFAKKDIIFLALIFFLILPFGSTDIFYYRGLAKAEIEQNINPYKGGFYKQIEILDIIQGPLGETMYPPVWLQVNKQIYKIAPKNEIISIYIYKLFALISFLVSYFLIKKFSDQKNAIIFATNPLILFELLTNAHLDIYLILLLISSIILFLKNKIYISILLLFAASMIKFNAILSLPFFAIYAISKGNSIKDAISRIIKLVVTFLLGTGIITLLYKPYWFGLKTLEGISKQADWPYNTIFERIVFTKLNPMLYLFNGKYNSQSFRDIWIFLSIIGIGIVGLHIFKNLEIRTIRSIKNLDLNKIKITKNSVLYYSGLILFVFPTIMMRSFHPWYLTWSAMFFIFSKFKYKKRVLALQTLILAIYYPTIYLVGHFVNLTSAREYNYMFIIEVLLVIVILILLYKSRINIMQTKNPTTSVLLT